MKIKIDENLEILESGEDFREYVRDAEATTLAANLHPVDAEAVMEALDTLEGDMFTSQSDYGNLIRRDHERILEGRRDVIFCCRLSAQDGTWHWVCMRAVRDRDALGFPAISLEIGSAEDLLEGRAGQKDREEVFLDLHAIEAYAKAKCAEQGNLPVAIGIANIDHFQEAKKARGTSGEEIVSKVAEIMAGSLGPLGKLGRLSTDELMFVVDRAKDRIEIRNILRYIRENTEREFRDEDGNATVTVSIGLAIRSGYASGYEDLFTLADKMLYRAKEKGRNRYIIYTPEIHGDVLHSWILDAAKTAKTVEYTDPVDLVLRMMDGYLRTQSWAVGAGFRPVCSVFELDAAYLFYKDLRKSRYGYRRAQDGSLPIPAGGGECTEEMLFAADERFAALFDENGLLYVRDVSAFRSSCEPFYDYLTDRGYRHGLLYFFRNTPGKGFIAFFDQKPEECGMTQVQERDLTYIAGILEIAVGTR